MTVFSEFEKSTARFPDRPFLHVPAQATRGYRNGPVDLTYAGALAGARELAGQFAASDYGHGMRIALLLDNRAECLLHLLALNSLGASIVPVNSSLSSREMNYIIGHSDAALVVSLPEHLDAARAAAPSGVRVHACDVPENLPPARIERLPGQAGDMTEAALLYTSGTTGRPKGCMLSNEYFLCMGNWYRELGGYCELDEGRERLVTPLPLVHMNALACSSMGMIMTGGCLIQLDRFHASDWWQTLRDSGATCLHYLGVMPAILLNQAPSRNDNQSGRIKFGFGAGVDPRHQQRFEERFGFPLIEGWAMTETGTEVCIAANRQPRHPGTRCIGKPTGALDYRLVDEEGRDVTPGLPGELLVRVSGPTPRRGFFSGYYKDPEATAQAWEGGYFHTGDVVRVDEDGQFYFVDRRKNIVRRSGENIAAVEVEGVLYQHESVAGCAVTPVPDEIRGEEVAACIVAREPAADRRAAAQLLFDFCVERLAYYKVPGYYLFVQALPMTASQKMQRGEVKLMARAMIERGEAVDLRAMKKPKQGR